MSIIEDWDNWKDAKDSFIVNLTVKEMKILLKQAKQEVFDDLEHYETDYQKIKKKHLGDD
jgi:hypothetical protein